MEAAGARVYGRGVSDARQRGADQCMPTHDKCMPTHLLTQCIATQRPPAAGPNTGGARDGIGRAHQALLGCVARRSTMRLAYRAAARGDLTLGTDCPRAGQPPLLRWYVPSVFLVSSTSCVCACVRVRVCVCVCVCHVISVLACVESVSSLKRRVSRVWSVWRVASGWHAMHPCGGSRVGRCRPRCPRVRGGYMGHMGVRMRCLGFACKGNHECLPCNQECAPQHALPCVLACACA